MIGPFSVMSNHPALCGYSPVCLDVGSRHCVRKNESSASVGGIQLLLSRRNYVVVQDRSQWRANTGSTYLVTNNTSSLTATNGRDRYVGALQYCPFRRPPRKATAAPPCAKYDKPIKDFFSLSPYVPYTSGTSDRGEMQSSSSPASAELESERFCRM